MNRARIATWLPACLLVSGACGLGDDSSSRRGEIKGGTPAIGYPELVKLRIPPATGCTGVIIGRRLVMTAGHCLDSWNREPITVDAPYVPTQAKGIDIVIRGTSPNNFSRDVGYILLDRPIELASYPRVRAVSNGDRVQHFGRKRNGEDGPDIYVSEVVRAKKPKFLFFVPVPFSKKFYTGPGLLNPGDSGGPVMLAGQHTVVGVNSGTHFLPQAGWVLLWFSGKNIVTDLKGERIPDFGGVAAASAEVNWDTAGDSSGEFVPCDDPEQAGTCGNHVCDGGETCGTCQTDCGCAQGFHCTACMEDGECVPDTDTGGGGNGCVVDGVCDPAGESCASCPLDCGECCPTDEVCCGNGVVEAGEDCTTCPEDVAYRPTFSVSSTRPSTVQQVTFTADRSRILESPPPLWDLGNGTHLAGTPLQYTYPAPGTYSVILTATEARCGTTRLTPPTIVTVVDPPGCDFSDLPPEQQICCGNGTCDGGETDRICPGDGCPPCQGCALGACGFQPDHCGGSIWCGDCGQSCGAMGGHYCSGTSTCPDGYASLGPSYDCLACCQAASPPPGPSCGALGGTFCSPTEGCPAGHEDLGATYDCAACCRAHDPPPGPSCGALGGNYCSPNGTCPEGYADLGPTYDCTTCCHSPSPPPGPSCGALGGDHCSDTGSCPSGYIDLGATYDCDPCCQAGPDPCGGDPCCGDPCCGDPCCGDPCCGDPCCGDPCCGDPCCGDPCCGGTCLP